MSGVIVFYLCCSNGHDLDICPNSLNYAVKVGEFYCM